MTLEPKKFLTQRLGLMTSLVKIYDSYRNPVREEIFIKLLSINLLQTSVKLGAQEKILD